MRALLWASVACVPGLAWAEEIQLPLPVTAVELFPQGAALTLAAETELSAGRHTLQTILPQGLLELGQLTVTGGTLLATELGENTGFDPELFYPPAVRAADAAVDKASDAVDAKINELRALDAQLQALEAQAALVRSIGGGDALPTPEALAALAQTIGAELTRIAAERAAIEARLPVLQEEIATAEAELARKQAALKALRPPDDNWALASMTIEMDGPGPLAVALETVVREAGWHMSYDARLSGEAITLERNVSLFQGGTLPWVGASITLSTAQPSGQTEPSNVDRSIPRIFELQKDRMRSSPAPVMEAAVAADAALGAAFVTADLDGPVVSYALLEPVSVLPGANGARVSLPALTLPADSYIAASPRYDSTAFHVSEAENQSGEPILPGPARFYRDGALVGEGFMPPLPAGDSATLGFGPDVSVALEIEFLDQQEGDRGLIRGQNTREDNIRLTARNLGDAPKEIRLRHAIPTSQQEDLDIRVEMVPEPDLRDAEDLLGVMEWRLTLAPGASEMIALGFDMRWPEDQMLEWWP